MRVVSDTKVPIKIWASLLETEAEEQVRKVASLPFIFSHVALMPDAHAGKGSTIGTVIATKGAIIPSAVGVDIGCGMAACQLPFKVDVLDGKLAELRHSIERSIPTGRHGHDKSRMPSDRIEAIKAIGLRGVEIITTKVLEQCGTLGGGNHFIEICTDTEQNAWIMLHSGSRNIGKVLAEKHIDKAKGLMKQYFIDLPDPDLAFLAQGTPEFKAYMDDLNWAQSYAALNRQIMMTLVMEQIMRMFPNQIYTAFEIINCHHNYTQMENHYGQNVWVTRKGAVSAKAGEIGIIPGSMGVKSFIVRGLGNPESFTSCSHGAGRKMSRTKARATFTEADLALQTAGVECRKDKDVIDEIPGAYKDIDQVMNDQADLVEKVAELKQLICVKG